MNYKSLSACLHRKKRKKRKGDEGGYLVTGGVRQGNGGEAGD